MSRRRKQKISHAARQRQPAPEVLAFKQFLASLPPQLRATAKRAHRQQPSCLLCQQPFHALGVFVPYYPQRWGIPQGWQGGCVYAMCQTCLALPDRGDRVEDALWQDRAQAAAPWN